MLGEWIELLKEIFFFVSYVSEKNSFPKPMSAEEEKVCLARYRDGDEGARNQLIEHNMRLVAHIAKKYAGACRDHEDLISIGSIGLIKAITTYDETKGTHLATYAARCIENEMLMAIRALRKVKTEVSLQDPIGIDQEGNEITLIDVLGTDMDGVLDSVALGMQMTQVYAVMQQVLEPRELMILDLRYGLHENPCMPQREIARMLGISRSYVSRIEKHAVEKLTAALGKHRIYEKVCE